MQSAGRQFAGGRGDEFRRVARATVEEQHLAPLSGHHRYAHIIGRILLQLGKGPLSGNDLTLGAKRHRERELGLEATAGGDRGAREAFRQAGVEACLGAARGTDERLRVAGAPLLQAPPCRPQEFWPSHKAQLLRGVRQPSAHCPPPRRGDAGAYRLAEQRMRQPNDRAVSLRLLLDQSPPRQPHECRSVNQAIEQPDVGTVGDCHDLERAKRDRVKAGHARIDQVPHSTHSRQCPPPAPDRPVERQNARDRRSPNELAAEQRIPAGLLPDPCDGQSVHRAANQLRHELLNREPPERL